MNLEQRYQQASGLLDTLEREPVDDEGFRDAFRCGVEFLEVPNAEVADHLKVSRPSVGRWMSGQNLPHRGLRGPILAWLRDRVAERQRVLRNHIDRPEKTRSRGGRGRARAKPVAERV